MIQDQAKEKLDSFVARIREACERGRQAEFDLYQVCKELEDDGAWRIDGFRLYAQWLEDQGITASRYQGYRDGLELLGKDAVTKIGLSATRAIAKISHTAAADDPSKVGGIASKIYDAALLKVSGFRSVHEREPSEPHVLKLVRQAAKEVGIQVPETDKPVATREQYQRAVNALMQILELGDPKSVEFRIASKALAALGEVNSSKAA